MSAVCVQCEGELELRRRRTMSSVQIVRQCRACDAIAGQISAREIRDMARDEIEALPWAKHRRVPQPNSRKRAYNAHLKSSHWEKLKKLARERSGGECERKGWGCTGRATELGHKHYDKPFGQETLDDVEDCCRACNQEERRERITRHVLG